MRHWKTVAKDVIMISLVFMGLNLAGIICGVTVFLVFYQTPYDIFMELLFDTSLALLSTATPYLLTFLSLCGWYIVDLFVLKKKFPPINFKLNDFLTVRFERKETVIYVKDEPFKICKYLLMNVPLSEIYDYESIDQASEFYSKQLESKITPKHIGLSPEEEFKGHCSNLQVWVENKYNSCLLHKNLAFPLLKKLSSVGDPLAKEVFVQEIMVRFKSRATTVQIFLIQEGYIDFLKDNCVEDLFQCVVDKLVFYYLAVYYRRSRDLLSEIKVFNKLVEADSIHYINNMALANRYIKNNDTKNAILVFRKLLTLYPNDGKSLLFLANLYTFEKKESKAEKILNRLENSEFRFVKYENLNELDRGMYKLLKD